MERVTHTITIINSSVENGSQALMLAHNKAVELELHPNSKPYSQEFWDSTWESPSGVEVYQYYFLKHQKEVVEIIIKSDFKNQKRFNEMRIYEMLND